MAEFKAEDFARLFIREFLKKNKFDRAYNAFMEEDTRKPPGGTMKKSELTELLGMEYLEKSNKRTKLYTTMLDMVCGFLMKMKDHSGGVKLPGEDGPSPKKTQARQQNGL